MADEGTDVDLPGVDSGDCDDDSRWTPKLREGGSGVALSAGDAKAARDDDTPKTVIECPVCLQPCVHPVQLPCSHIFCFLCVKGVANRSKRCALCRQEIPLSFFHNPKLIRREELQRTSAFEDGFQWFYEGRNGWWQYDVRTSADLEDKFKAGETSFELLIAGFLYVIDLDSMLQYRRNDPTRRRRIKRDLENIPEKKGVAGLRTATAPANSRQGAYGVETDLASKRQTPQSGDCQQTSGTVLSPLSPPAPSNTPHNSQSPAVPGLSSMMAGLQISPGSDGTHPSSPSGASMAASSGQTSPSSLVPRALSRSPASPRNHQRSSTSASQRTGGTSQSQLSPRPRGNQQRLPRTQRAGRNDPAGDSRAPHAPPVRRTRSSSSLHTPSGVSTGGMSTGGGSDGSQSRGAVQIRQRRRQTSNRENQSS